jgi:hypothetical protein
MRNKNLLIVLAAVLILLAGLRWFFTVCADPDPNPDAHTHSDGHTHIDPNAHVHTHTGSASRCSASRRVDMV